MTRVKQAGERVSGRTSVRQAASGDVSFLIEHDHVRSDVIIERVETGQVLVVEDDGVLIAWLRWSLIGAAGSVAR